MLPMRRRPGPGGGCPDIGPDSGLRAGFRREMARIGLGLNVDELRGDGVNGWPVGPTNDMG